MLAFATVHIAPGLRIRPRKRAISWETHTMRTMSLHATSSWNRLRTGTIPLRKQQKSSPPSFPDGTRTSRRSQSLEHRATSAGRFLQIRHKAASYLLRAGYVCAAESCQLLSEKPSPGGMRAQADFCLQLTIGACHAYLLHCGIRDDSA